uniref:Uncharacterized protein n=1 Tax=Sciurus vulgaris TaxID=55149 RepID=A0A8D2AYI5_SCIVU
MTKCTKKVGIIGKYRIRYGALLWKIMVKTEISQRLKYTCSFCEAEARRSSSSRPAWSTY